jgi:hypothetical protein
MLYTAYNKIDLNNIYKNCCAFLILNGPSFKTIIESKETISLGGSDLLYKDALSFPGILTMGTNNGVKSFRPKLWTCVDDPGRFIKSIWLDPTIQKFVPHSHLNSKIFDNEKWLTSDIVVKNCPNVFAYHRNEKFNHNTFLTEDTFNWGDHKNYGGGRSVMLVAIRLLYYLGVRKIFLLGCDFNMDNDTKYHFDQDRTATAIKNNNNTYEKMLKRFELLKPIFNQYELYIYNCNKDSRLKTFDFIDIKDALNIAYGQMPSNLTNEPVNGMYNKDKKLTINNGDDGLEVIKVNESKTITRKKKK